MVFDHCLENSPCRVDGNNFRLEAACVRRRIAPVVADAADEELGAFSADCFPRYFPGRIVASTSAPDPHDNASVMFAGHSHRNARTYFPITQVTVGRLWHERSPVEAIRGYRRQEDQRGAASSRRQHRERSTRIVDEPFPVNRASSRSPSVITGAGGTITNRSLAFISSTRV